MNTKKIIIFVGSPRKKETWAAVHQFEDQLKAQIPCECEYIFLKDFTIEQCRGCFLCLTKGEEYCPLKDDRELLVSKILNSDGVVFATPNYSLQVTAIMKNFLDRIAYTFHRPCFFGKRLMAIITQGAYGGEAILKYFKNFAQFTGFLHVKGSVLTIAPSPRTDTEQVIIDRKIEQATKRFARSFHKSDTPKPALLMVAIFHLVRSMYRTTPDFSLKDVRYYRDNGWFSSSYYYPVRPGPLQFIAGFFMDRMGKSFALKRKRELAGK